MGHPFSVFLVFSFLTRSRLALVDFSIYPIFGLPFYTSIWTLSAETKADVQVTLERAKKFKKHIDIVRKCSERAIQAGAVTVPLILAYINN